MHPRVRQVSHCPAVAALAVVAGLVAFSPVALAQLDGDPDPRFGTIEYDASDTDFGVIRLNDDGSLDNTFSGDGKLSVPFDLGDDIDIANSVLVDRFGRIVLGGWANGGGSAALVRVAASGVLDATFGSGGKIHLPGPGRAASFQLSASPSERILFLRAGSPSGPSALTSAGMPDSTFGGDGEAAFSYPGGSANESLAMTLTGGQPLVVGLATVSGEERLILARYWTDLVFGDDLDGGNTSSWTRWPAW
jgi:uncharacterized delta-60 repeat protein